MEIHEDLLKLSEKEARIILAETSPYRAKFLIGNGAIQKIVRKEKNYLFSAGGTTIYHDEINNYHPLSYTEYKEAIIQNLKNVDEWPFERFRTWVVKQFKDAYGSEYVDDQGDYIVVYFPEIIIRNTAEQEHIMRDIYLRFTVAYDGVKLYYLKRTTFTDSEIRNVYVFSHLHANWNEWESNFCFGETQLKILRNSVRSNRHECFNNLRFFLEALKEYLSWESLEGKPYNYIDNVINDKTAYESAPRSEYNLDDVYTNLKGNLNSFTYDFVSREDQYEIKISPTSRKEIANILAILYPKNLRMNINGKNVESKNPSIIDFKEENSVFFKGKWKPFKIIIQQTEEPVKKICSYMLEDVITKLEEEFKQFLTNKRINEYNS